jgi:hypothetical protein
MIEPRFVDSYSYQTKLVIPDVNWCIYGHPVNFNYFVNTPLVPAVDGERVFTTKQKKAHTRRRFVGDPAPSNVQAHSYAHVYDPGRKTGTAIPGWSFILSDGVEKRQFTTTGDVILLIDYLEKNLKMKCKLYTQGANTEIAAAAAEG